MNHSCPQMDASSAIILTQESLQETKNEFQL